MLFKKFEKRLSKSIVVFLSFLIALTPVGVTLVPQNVDAMPAPIQNLCEADVDVAMIIDRSGSMNWDNPTRLSQAKIAANNFVSYLGVNDQSALVSFATNASLDKELSNNHSVTQANINNLVAGGGTNIGKAIDLANQELGSTRANPQAVPVEILITDGDTFNPTFAEAKAQEAAALGYKIFTIGLGSDVNTALLEYIADITGAEYYYAPSAGDLEGIYDSIRWQICQYGSISGCKYEDTDKDGNVDDETITIPGWEIILSGDSNATQLTDGNGCYQFSGLLPGTYTVSEGGKIGVGNFEQTYPPCGGVYNINLAEGENLEDYDFGNYIPSCGNNILDDTYGEECDDGNNDDNDGCSANCTIEELPEATLVVTKIVCDEESMLPNWGSGGPNITETTATDYVAQNPGCHLTQDWNFQYGDQNVSDPGGDFYGEAGCGWTTFGPTDVSGEATVDIDIDGMTQIRVREVLQTGYIPFTYPPEDITESAEFYCNGDVYHYDNFDWIIGPQADETYYCVAFNAPIEPTCSISGHKYNYGIGGDNLIGWTIGVAHIVPCNEGDEWADSVVNYSPQGTIAPERTDPSKALGVAERNDTINFVSLGMDIPLGLGGSIVLGFDNIILNGTGDDIEVVETSFGNPSCQEYPEKAHVYASQNGTDWEDLGIGCLDSTFDLGNLPWAKYVKLVDESDQQGDGYDIDGVRAIHCGNYETVMSTTTDENGYCFEGLSDGDYAVYEVMQEGWNAQKVMVNGIFSDFFVNSFFDVFVEVEVENGITTVVDFWNQEDEINYPPVIFLTQPSITITVGDSFDPFNGHATTSDPDGDDVTLYANSSVDTSIEGNYEVEYTAEDEHGAWATPQTLEVIVEEEPAPQSYCGDGNCDSNESCSSCPADCGECYVPSPDPEEKSSGGNGWIFLEIHDVQYDADQDGKVIFTWRTNKLADSQVFCDPTGHNPNWGEKPDYGYALHTDVYNNIPGVTQHKVSMQLDAGTTYYCRVQSHDFSVFREVKAELTFSTLSAPEPEPVEEPPVVIPSVCVPLLDKYIKLGANNDIQEVKDLEWFLNTFESENLVVNGVYEQHDFEAVKRFQEKYREDVLDPWGLKNSTGHVYYTTRKKINEIYCGREFPLTPEQQKEIDYYKNLYTGYIKKD